MNAHEVKEKFLAELRELFGKYDAEIEASDHWMGYAECGEDIRMTVEIPAVYDKNNDCIREAASIDLGEYFTG